MRSLTVMVLTLVLLGLTGGVAQADAERHGRNCQGSLISFFAPDSMGADFGAATAADAQAGVFDEAPPKNAACSTNNGVGR